ncbi:MAG: diguanylate cyclase [SAR324 cluster bacterium]|nr:diguanylate cyclase [SAR324 cluster bacterium]MCZ6532265.1 diguanylate cyclase [SAR324 cluster bacterium]MCZ6557588.1 diguanylate cyclase [SAR324 cluster bacterium]MCZ6645775.1 diguanylate cyclase [SAR324 cluster bacterium]MCZ6730712.1 diguanylate cyclase [SAR324 cluster bacterium]
MTKILIVDDSEDNLTLTSLVLQRDDYEIITAMNGRDALRIAQIDLPDVILLDVQMPDLDGFEVCRRLKGESDTENIPVLFLTAKHKDIDSVSLGLSLGAEDYIVKPFSSIELRARVSVLARLKNQMDELGNKNQQLESANQALADSNEQILQAQKALEQMAITDPLTALYNRRYFTERLSEAFAMIDREPVVIHLLMFDLDHFKKVNDTYGHQMGDAVLLQFSHILRRAVRKNDIIARIGGEEFVIAMLNIPSDRAHLAADRIRMEVEGYKFEAEGYSLSVTTSIGVASYPDLQLENPTLETMLHEADEALYYAKSHGRNRTVIAPAPKD